MLRLQACYSGLQSHTILDLPNHWEDSRKIITASSEAEEREMGCAADGSAHTPRSKQVGSIRRATSRPTWLVGGVKERGGVPATRGGADPPGALRGPPARAHPLAGAEENVAQVQKWNVGGVRER